jgi:hypothetical protein
MTKLFLFCNISPKNLLCSREEQEITGNGSDVGVFHGLINLNGTQ